MIAEKGIVERIRIAVAELGGPRHPVPERHLYLLKETADYIEKLEAQVESLRRFRFSADGMDEAQIKALVGSEKKGSAQ